MALCTQQGWLKENLGLDLYFQDLNYVPLKISLLLSD